MDTPSGWRDFEVLVARIEEIAAPKGAVVRSPDRLPDTATGRMRPVDASIRYRVGSAQVLITLECQKRKRKAGTPWIEELATRRTAIGADKTIAVSAAGFTQPALVAAKHHGIDTRTLSEVSPSDIENWFLVNGAVHVFRVIEDVRCFIVLYDDFGEPSRYGFYAPSVDDPVFYQDGIKSPFPISLYLLILERVKPEVFADVPLDGTKVEREFPIQWEQGSLLVAMTDGRKSVHLTKFSARISYESAVCDLESGVHHEYADSDGVKIQRTAFNTDLLGMPVLFEHQAGPDGKQKVLCRFSPPHKDKD